MMFLIFILIPIFVCLIYYLIIYRAKERTAEVMKLMVPQVRIEGRKIGLSRWINIGDKKSRTSMIIVTGALLGGVSSLLTGGSFLLTAGAGALVPWLIIKQMELNYEKRYREDGRAAITFLHGIITSNGSLEDWLVEVIPRLNGPLKAQFRLGHENNTRGVPITKFLESLIRDCPDSGLNLVFSGILREQRQAGDMIAFISGALKDMQNQDRFIRVMGQVRKSGSQMLVWVYCFPVFFYFLFSGTVNATLKNHPIANFGLIVAIAGYAGLAWWGARVTRTKLS